MAAIETSQLLVVPLVVHAVEYDPVEETII
jgi:hypothetical protein